MQISELYENTILEVEGRLLSAPLLNRIKDMSGEQLHYFFSQIYYFVDLFPGFLGSLLQKTNNKQLQFAIVDNLVDECGGIEKLKRNDFSGAHSCLLKKFLHLFDYPLATKSIHTTILIDSFNKLFVNSTLIETLAAIASMECTSTKWFNLILEQLHQRSEYTKDQLHFFELHTVVDEVHGDVLRDVLLPMIRDKKSSILFKHGVMTSLENWLRFYSAISDEIGLFDKESVS